MPRKHQHLTSLRALLCALACMLSSASTAASLHVGSAANFTRTLEALAPGFEAASGHRLRWSSASSGVLYAQILHGAPFDVFLSADSERPQRLEADGLALPGSRRTYARGLLLLAVREGFKPTPDAAGVLASPGLSLVIANPDHAPYGVAAAAVLDQVETAADLRLLRAANVGQAFQMWRSGGIDAALVSRSYRPEPALPVPEHWYDPIEQQAVIIKRTREPEAARAFMAYLGSASALEILRAHGYEPGDPP